MLKNTGPGRLPSPCGWYPQLGPQIHQKSYLKNTPKNDATGHPKVSPRGSKIDRNPEKVASRNGPQKNTGKSAENDPLPPSKTMVSHWRGCKNHNIQESPKGTKNTSQIHPQINLKSRKIVSWTPPSTASKIHENATQNKLKMYSQSNPKSFQNRLKIDTFASQVSQSFTLLSQEGPGGGCRLKNHRKSTKKQQNNCKPTITKSCS